MRYICTVLWGEAGNESVQAAFDVDLLPQRGKTMRLIRILSCLSAFLLACGDGDGTNEEGTAGRFVVDGAAGATASPGTALVRLIHVASSLGAVDVWVDDATSPSITNMGFEQGTRYVELPTGMHSFAVDLSTDTPRARPDNFVFSTASVPLFFEPEVAYTFLLFSGGDEGTQTNAILLTDSLSALGTDMIRVRPILLGSLKPPGVPADTNTMVDIRLGDSLIASALPNADIVGLGANYPLARDAVFEPTTNTFTIDVDRDGTEDTVCPFSADSLSTINAVAYPSRSREGFRIATIPVRISEVGAQVRTIETESCAATRNSVIEMDIPGIGM